MQCNADQHLYSCLVLVVANATRVSAQSPRQFVRYPPGDANQVMRHSLEDREAAIAAATQRAYAYVSATER